MLDIKEIEQEIMKLEECDYTTYNVCKKLAILYIVRDHYIQKNNVAPTTRMSATTSSPMMSMPTV